MDPILGPRNLLKTGFATIPCTCLDPSEKRFEARQGLAETTPRTQNNWHKDKARLTEIKIQKIMTSHY